MERTVTAIALATVLVAAGLGVAPPAAASQFSCDQKDFDLADSQSGAMVRNLDPGESIVGKTVVQSGSPEDLFIELHDEPRKLDWTVYKDDSGICQDIESGQITHESSTPVVRATLEDDPLTDEEYWVVYENAGTQSFDFETWTEV